MSDLICKQCNEMTHVEWPDGDTRARAASATVSAYKRLGDGELIKDVSGSHTCFGLSVNDRWDNCIDELKLGFQCVIEGRSFSLLVYWTKIDFNLKETKSF